MQTKPIIYNFYHNQPQPLDKRQQKVVDLNSLPPLPVRYSGLIIHVESENEPYIFLNDLTTPLPLRSLTSNSVLSVNTSNYRNLITILNSITTTTGSLITVFPLNTTFIRTASGWKYFNGTYNLTSTVEYENLPSELKTPNKRVIINSTEYVITNSLALSTLIISESSTPSVLENERYYMINDILYYSIGNKLWKLGGSSLVLSNVSIINGDNTFNHGLDSTFLDVKIWVNIGDKLTPIHSVNYSIENRDSIILNSYLDITNVTIIINTI